MRFFLQSHLTILPLLAKDHLSNNRNRKQKKSSFDLIRIVLEVPRILQTLSVAFRYPLDVKANSVLFKIPFTSEIIKVEMS